MNSKSFDKFNDPLNILGCGNTLEEIFSCSLFDKNKNSPKVLKTDIYEDDGNTVFLIDAPGIDKGKINVEYKDLFLNVTIKFNNKLDKVTYLKQERPSKSISRNYYLGEINPSDICAKLDNGVLKITLPKGIKSNNTIDVN